MCIRDREGDTPESIMTSRLEAFGEWLKRRIVTTSYFVCDQDGKVLVDHVQDEKLIEQATQLSRNSEKSTGLQVKVSSEKIMEVFQNKSGTGSVILGVLVPAPLLPETVKTVAAALEISLDESLDI